MSGTGGAEVLEGGPPDEPGPAAARQPQRRGPAWLVPLIAALLGVVVGAVGTHVSQSGQGGRSGAQAAAAGSAAQSSGGGPAAPSSGVVVPEVVNAQTLPSSGGMEVVAPTVAGASTPGPLRYDYSLVGAAWLAPDGTVRSGPPACVRTVNEVQFLLVAVVHARAVAGGPDTDRVVWFRCADLPATGPS